MFKSESETNTSNVDEEEPVNYISQTEDIVEIADVKFNIKGQILHACKASLSIASPVFKAMFKLDFKEKEQDEIELPGKDFKAMLQFIEVTHACDVPSSENVFNIVPICHEYQCTRFLNQCEQILLADESLFDNLETLIKTLALGSNYGFEELKQKCLSSAEMCTMDKVKLCNSFSDLSNSTYMELLEQSNEVKDKALRDLIDIAIGEGCSIGHTRANHLLAIKLGKDFCHSCQHKFFTKFEAILKVFDVMK